MASPSPPSTNADEWRAKIPRNRVTPEKSVPRHSTQRGTPGGEKAIEGGLQLISRSQQVGPAPIAYRDPPA